MASKKARRQKKKSIEDIYCNNDFVPPKEQNLETIFEEPRRSREGLPILTSVRKYKRYLHFDPTQNKIQKRQRKAKKCLKRLKTNYRNTRSSPQNSNNDDIFLHILDAKSDSSSDSDMEASPAELANETFPEVFINTERRLKGKTSSFDAADVFDTPTKPPQLSQLSDDQNYRSRLSESYTQTMTTDGAPNTTEVSVVAAPEADTKEHAPEENVQSPRRSCIIS